MTDHRQRFSPFSLLATLGITLCCFVFTYFYYGFYYVEYEGLFDSFYSGKLTEGMPFRSIYFLGNIGLSHLYSYLYELNPDVEWISWILYGYLFISCYLGLVIVDSLLPNRWPVVAKWALQVLVYLLVFSDHNTHFIFTRVAYMVTGLSLLGIVFFFKEPGTIQQRLGLFIALNLWFVVGVLTRSESATAVLLQLAFFGLVYVQNLKRTVLLLVWPTVFLLAVLSAIAYDLKTSKEYYKQVEPEIEAQLCERENIVPLSTMPTARDSAKWMAARTIMWADPKVLTPNYLRSLIRPEKFIYTDVAQWKRACRDMSAIVARFWYLALMCLVLGLAMALSGALTTKTAYIYWGAFVLSFWWLIALQTYTVKVNDRSFSPLISLFVLCHLVWLANYVRNPSPWLMRGLGLAGFVLFGFHLQAMKNEANQLKQDLLLYRNNAATIAELAKDKYLIVNSTSCDYLFSSNEPFRPFDFSAYKKIYITDGFNIPYLPYYRRYLEKECACSVMEFPAFWEYLITKKQDAVIVSSKERMDILITFLREVHHYDLPVNENEGVELIKLQKSDARGLYTNLKVYRFSENN